jgi:predicted Zn-dependent protease
LLKISDEEIERRIADARCTEALLAFHYGALERAHTIVAQMLESGAPLGKWRVLATAVLISIGKTQEGIDLARRYLGTGDGTLEERAILMNNLAWALVDPAQAPPAAAKLAEADELSAHAFAVLPMANAVRGTRAAVLVAKGQCREAVELLADKRFRLEPSWSRATVKATLALAFAELGDLEQAARTIEEAASLAPGNRQLARARTRVALPPAHVLG